MTRPLPFLTYLCPSLSACQSNLSLYLDLNNKTTGPRKLQIIRRSKDNRPLPQMLFQCRRPQRLWQIQRYRRHAIRIW